MKAVTWPSVSAATHSAADAHDTLVRSVVTECWRLQLAPPLFDTNMLPLLSTAVQMPTSTQLVAVRLFVPSILRLVDSFTSPLLLIVSAIASPAPSTATHVVMEVHAMPSRCCGPVYIRGFPARGFLDMGFSVRDVKVPRAVDCCAER